MSSELPVCKHCGSPLPQSRTDAFCCAGCAYVFDLLHEQGLDHFYDLKGTGTLPPVSPQSLRERDYEWLVQMAKDNEEKGAMLLSLQGLSCVGCVWLIEKIFSRHSGGLRVNVDITHATLGLTYDETTFDVVAFAKDMQSFGYLVGPPQEGMKDKQASGLERRMGLCGAFAMNAMAFSLPAYFGMPEDFVFASWFDMITAVSATLAMLVGGSYFIEKAWQSLRMRALHIDTPIALGIIASYLGSLGGWFFGVSGLKYFDFVAIFIFLMLVGRWAQQAAVEKNRRKLMRDTSIPESVAGLEDGRSYRVSELKPGMQFVIKPGQSIPVACSLFSDAASVSLEWINGESEAQHRRKGQLLPAGALNIGVQTLEVKAVENWESSVLRKLLEARRAESYRDRRLERVLRVYLAVVVVVGIAGAVGWLWNGSSLADALQVMISIFVVSCPCALGVAVPLAEDLAAGRAERMGVFVRHLGFWQRLRRIRQVVFDKTGTLTLENPVLENSEELRALDKQAQAALRRLVSGNLHPVSRSLFDVIGLGESLGGSEVVETIGQGLSFTDGDGHEWFLGRGEGADAVLRKNGDVVARFRFRDELRAESLDEVRMLRARGLRVTILSGDREPKVAHIGKQLGLMPTEWLAGLTPEQKASWLQNHDGENSLYVGDGANDSLAFDVALCAGSPVTGRSFLEQKADFFFLGHSLRFASGLLDIARTHKLATRSVFGFSVVYNIATVIAGLLGYLNPLAAAILMPLSSVATLSIVAFTFRRGKKVRRMNGALLRHDVQPPMQSAPAIQ